MSQSPITQTIINSPAGDLYVAANEHALLWLGWKPAPLTSASESRVEYAGENPVIEQCRQQLAEYFERKRQTFDLPLEVGGTPFQRQAWRALGKIGYGETVSYRQQAEHLGDAKKARAVGSANGKNPFSIVVPCHRVVATDGTLGGYAGGLKAKRFLLDLEGLTN